MDIYNDSERARIRAVLIDYMKDNRVGTPKLYERLCKTVRRSENLNFSFKTFQRFIAGTVRVSDDAVAVCARFAKALPNNPNPFQALGEALHALYKAPFDPDVAGHYRLFLPDGDHLTEIDIASPSDGFALVTERHIDPAHRLHDGVMISIGTNEYMILSRDRLMLSPRYIWTYGDTAFVHDQARYQKPTGPGGRVGSFTRE